MSLSTLSPTKAGEEKDIQKSIFGSISKNEDLIFSSGAGAGKTYALIESLKFIIKEYGERLNHHNQRVICITYTNVATEEVKARLGNSDLVKVSTIHERIWELIKDHQNELIVIHEAKLREEITLLNTKINHDKKFDKYQALTEGQKSTFKDIMISEKDLFYISQDEKSKEFKLIFNDLLESYPDILKNLANFKSLVNTIYRIENYTSSLKKIEVKEKGFKEVVYNAAYNVDRLHWMRISHDTLLEYGLKIIKAHKLLRQIIIDKYPYFLIDEYQDTNAQVIEIMSILSEHSKEINHNLFVGYFGDSVQNIFDGGIGKEINKVHSNLKHINKPFNRRSTKEVIDVINIIRNDEIKQESIFDDSEGGSVKFYSGDRNKIESFTDKCFDEWDISMENKLHCLVLTNKSVAFYNGFSNIYTFFAGAKKYKGTAYKQLNTELLSDDKSKLGEVPILIFRILDFRNKLQNKNTSVQDILDKNIYSEMNIIELRKFISLLKSVNGNNLKEYIASLIETYNNNSDKKFKTLMNRIFDFEGFPEKSLTNYLSECLYPNAKVEDLEDIKNQIETFLCIDLTEFDLWYKYILRDIEKEIVYHTYHGTKGLEFKNVLILMENSFGTTPSYFNKYFIELTNNEKISEDYQEKFEQTKNLLYVACSRAIKNLRVLYMDDIENFKMGIEKVFGSVEKV